MTLKTIDCAYAVIYKIQHLNLNDLIYVGSTTNFTKRKYHHKMTLHNERGNGFNLKLYKTIRENGGWEMFSMVIVKEYPCKNREECRTEEDRIMRDLKATLNMVRPTGVDTEKRKATKEKHSKLAKQSFTCECGTTMMMGNRHAHLKTKRHCTSIKTM